MQLPPASSEIMALASQPQQAQHLNSQMQTPFQPPKKQRQTLSQTRAKPSQTQVYAQMDHEQLFDEATRLKQCHYDMKDELQKLKAKLKISEAEGMKKDK